MASIKILVESKIRPTRAYYGGRFWMLVDAFWYRHQVAGAYFGMPLMKHNYRIAGQNPCWDQVLIDWIPGPPIDL